MQSFLLDSPQASLRYHDLPGEGPPLLFVHGLGCASSCDYPRIAADPALAGRRVLLVDLLGSGFSDRPIGFGYTVADHAGCVAALVDHLAPDAVDLFGHSMGGAVAIVAATLLGGRVRRLVLGEPNLDPGGGEFSRRVASVPEADYVARGHDELVAASRSEGRDLWAASLSISAPYAVHRGAASLIAGSRPSWRDMLVGMAMPRTVIFGEASLPSLDTEALPRDGVAVSIVPKAGHAMAGENPAGLAAALREALA